jgi:hypothetical protein
MNSNAHPTLSSAAASSRPAASLSLELSAARQARDGLATLLRAERTAAADFLLALADFDRRRDWERLGHASLFAFLVAELGLSKGAAYVRFTAARLLQDFPEVIEPIREGKLCLSAVGELARVATAENFATVLPRFFGCSSRESREVAAAIIPRQAPPTRDQVTRLVPSADQRVQFLKATGEGHVAASPLAVPAALSLDPPVDSDEVRAHEPVLTHPARAVAPRDEVEPLTAELRRLHVTVDAQFLKMLDAARDGLSHSIPGANMEQVLKAGLELLLEKQARARGQAKRPRATVVPTSTPTTAPTLADDGSEPVHRRTGPREAIPAAVRRAVWERDGGRCTWPLDSGDRCGSTHRIELDHQLPWARWGAPTVDGLRLLCHSHNSLAATLAFGARWMGRYRGRPGAKPDQRSSAESEPAPTTRTRRRRGVATGRRD